MSSSTYNRRKGASWESALAEFFTDHGTFGQEVFRAPRWGAKDKGDLTNTRDFVVQAKAVKSITLSDFLDEVREQIANAAKRWGFAVIKRRNHSTERAYAVMELGVLADFISDYYRLEEELRRLAA